MGGGGGERGEQHTNTQLKERGGKGRATDRYTAEREGESDRYTIEKE